MLNKLSILGNLQLFNNSEPLIHNLGGKNEDLVQINPWLMELEELHCGICNEQKRTEKDGEECPSVGASPDKLSYHYFSCYVLLFSRTSIPYVLMCALAGTFNLLSFT